MHAVHESYTSGMWSTPGQILDVLLRGVFVETHRVPCQLYPIEGDRSTEACGVFQLTKDLVDVAKYPETPKAAESESC